MAKYDYKDELAAAGKNKALFADQLNILQQTEKITDDITQNFEDQLDIGKQLAENEKNIFSHNVNIKSIITKLNKARKDGTEEEIKTLEVLLDQAKTQKKVRNDVDAALKSHQKAMAPWKKFASMVPGIGSTLSAGIDAYSDSFKKGLGESMKHLSEDQQLVIKKQKGMTAGFKVVGLAIATYIGKNLLSAMQSTGASLMDILSRPEFIFFGAESRAIADEFGNLEESSLKLGANMKMMAFFSGVSAENQAKILGAMAATSDASLDTLHSQMASYKQAGVPFKAIMDDVANNMEFTAKFGKDGAKNIMDAAAKARELGINLGDVASISNSLLDFESSIEKQMEAQVLLGRNLNLDKARQLAFTGDTVGLQNEVMRLVGSEAEFNKMNYLQREALAGAVGLSVERLGALVRVEKAGNEETQSKFKWFVGIGAAAIGIASAIIGAITMGGGVKASLKGALKGGIGGGLVGAGIGASAHSIMNSTKVPKLAEGGIVNSPMLAMVGERGREAVVPLGAQGVNVDMKETNELLRAGAQGVNVDMKETNELLRALLGSSEKQVNRLGDIGTS